MSRRKLLTPEIWLNSLVCRACAVENDRMTQDQGPAREDSAVPEHILENQRYWDDMADDWVAAGERAWASPEPHWGQWRVADAVCPLLPQDMSGMDAIELGCGTGYISAWMVKRGAVVTAIDNSEKQLATARRLAAENNVEITFIHGNAEAIDLPDASLDFAVSEYGAAIWCDPELWIPEAHRLLRPAGRLVFLGNSPLRMVCAPADGTEVSFSLQQNYFALGSMDWRHVEVDPGGVEFNRSLSAWFELFNRVGFNVDNYLEPQAPETASGSEYWVSAEWAKRYPSEQVFFLTRC